MAEKCRLISIAGALIERRLLPRSSGFDIYEYGRFVRTERNRCRLCVPGMWTCGLLCGFQTHLHQKSSRQCVDARSSPSEDKLPTPGSLTEPVAHHVANLVHLLASGRVAHERHVNNSYSTHTLIEDVPVAYQDTSTG